MVRDNRANRVSGSQDGQGGGIATFGPMTLTDCLIVDNRVTDGGGIAVFRGMITLEGSTTVQGNQADTGGDIFAGGGSLTIAETCRVTRNTAAPGNGDGGGIFSNFIGTVTLQGADPSPIMVDNCRENSSPTRNVPKCAATPIFCSS